MSADMSNASLNSKEMTNRSNTSQQRDTDLNETSGPDEAVVAHHEAGHLLAALRLNIPFSGREVVTIVPGDHYRGKFTLRNILANVELEWDPSDRSRAKMERIVQACLAGIEAQRRYDPSSIRYGTYPGDWDGGDDYRQAINLIDHFSSGQRETEAYLELLTIRAANLVQAPHNWKCISALAESLLTKRTLSKRQAMKVVRTAKDEFVRSAIASRAPADQP